MLEVIPSAFAKNKLESGLVDPVTESKKQEEAMLAVVQATNTPSEYLPVKTLDQRAERVIDFCVQHGLLSAGEELKQ